MFFSDRCSAAKKGQSENLFRMAQALSAIVSELINFEVRENA